jgi:hypothetical protein
MKDPKKAGDVVVLPITSFSPGAGQMGAGDYDDPMAFVKHELEGMSPFPQPFEPELSAYEAVLKPLTRSSSWKKCWPKSC